MKILFVALVLLVTALPVNSFAKTSYDSLPVPKKGGNLNESSTITPISLNPLLITDASSREIAGSFYLSLFGTDGATYESYPELAEKLNISNDKKDYTFTLDHRAKWADGTSVTSDDVQFTFEKLMDPKVDAAVLRGFFEGVTFQKIDKLTFKFHVDQPKFNSRAFIESFTTLQKKQFDKESNFNSSRENLHPVGTGPFTVKTLSRDQMIVLARNPDWWAKDLPQFKAKFNQDTWTYKVIGDPALNYEKFLRGEIDVITFTAEQYMNQVLKTDKEKFGTSRTSGKAVWQTKLTTDASMPWYGLALNFQSPIFRSKDTRKGLAYLVDYQTIIQKAYFGMLTQCVSPFGSKTENTDPALKLGKGIYTYDPKKGLDLLKKDGWKQEDGQAFLVKDIDGKKTPLHFALKYYGGNPANSNTAVILKESFKKNGVDLDLKPMDGTAMYKDFDDRNFEAAFMGWGGGSIFPDAKQNWSSASIDHGSNKMGYSSPKVDELIAKSNLEFDRKKRAKMLQGINRVLYEDVPYIFLVERHQILEGFNSKFKSPKWIERYTSSPAEEMFYE